jgi:hypothetical protein
MRLFTNIPHEAVEVAQIVRLASNLQLLLHPLLLLSPNSQGRLRQQRGLLGLLLVRYLGFLDLKPVDQLVNPPLVDDLELRAGEIVAERSSS